MKKNRVSVKCGTISSSKVHIVTLKATCTQNKKIKQRSIKNKPTNETKKIIKNIESKRK